MKTRKNTNRVIPSTLNPKVGIMAFPASFKAGFAQQIKKRFVDEAKQNRSL